jgi:hypothetical protein
LIYLDFPTKKIQAVLAGAVTANQPEVSLFFFDHVPQATTTVRRGAQKVSTLNSTTDVDICDAPVLQGIVRNVHTIIIYNKDTAAVSVTVKLDDAGTETVLVKQTLAAGESMMYEDQRGWHGVDVISLPVDDSTELVRGSVDGTKRMRFEVDGFTAGQTRVITPPNESFTMVGLATTQALTNKTVDLASNTLVATSAQVAAAVTDETGSGALVFATSPTLVTPAIGTPSSGTLTNCTGLTESGFASGSVSQAKLKTTTASGSTNVSSAAQASYTLTGGTYSWWTAGATNNGLRFGNGDVGAGVIGVYNDTGGALDFYVDERYVQASPPYNLGNGDIPLFVFALLDSLGNFKGISVAPDPTWAYHGPTDISPERIENGKSYRCYREINGIPFNTAIKDAETAEAFMAGEISAQSVEREITRSLKNSDMNLYPHPWVGNNLSGLTAVMLDPLSATVGRLAIIQQEGGAAEVRNLIQSGYIAIDSAPVDASAPAGIVVCRCSWKG